MEYKYISARIEYDPRYNFWFVQVLLAKGDSPPSWRRHRQKDTPEITARAFPTQQEAEARALELNSLFEKELANEPDAERRLSLQLRAQKARQSQKRLRQEEELMLAIGRARGLSDTPIAILPAKIHQDDEKYRDEIESSLKKYPYIRSIAVGNALQRRLVKKLEDDSWSKSFRANRKGLIGAHRAPIANGFGLNEFAHYGKTKAEIRRILCTDPVKTCSGVT